MRWIAGEAWRNLLSGTSHALRNSLILTAMLGVALVADVQAVDDVLQRAADYRDAGGSITTLEAVGQVDGKACEELASVPGIQAAGALRQEPSPLAAATLPRGPIATFAVTEGTLAVVGMKTTGPGDNGIVGGEIASGIVVSEEVAQALGLNIGAKLPLTTGSTTVRGTFRWPDDGRRAGFGYAAFVPSITDKPFDHCWVAAWPIPDNLTTLLRTTVRTEPDTDATVTLSRLNTSLGTTFDGEAAFNGRVTRYAAVAAAAAGLIMGFAAIRSRRLELASARHVGVGPLAQHLQIFLETVAWIGATTVLLGTVATLAVYGGGSLDDAIILQTAAHVVLAGTVSTLLGAQCAVATTQERHLFRYFKAR